MNITDRLVTVATDVRTELESFRDCWNAPPDLTGFCMYGAIMLWQALRRKRREPILVEGYGHWFTHCDRHLVDVTASQFGYANVIVRPLTKYRDPEQHWAVMSVYQGPLPDLLMAYRKRIIKTRRHLKAKGV